MIILSIQKSKSKQGFLIYCLQKALENRIELFLTEKQIKDSFMIFDDNYVITTPKNFNFRYLYTQEYFAKSDKVNDYLKIWFNFFKWIIIKSHIN